MFDLGYLFLQIRYLITNLLDVGRYVVPFALESGGDGHYDVRRGLDLAQLLGGDWLEVSHNQLTWYLVAVAWAVAWVISPLAVYLLLTQDRHM